MYQGKRLIHSQKIQRCVGELKVYCHLKFNPIEAESVMVHNAQNLQVRFGSSNADTFLKFPHTKNMGDERGTR